MCVCFVDIGAPVKTQVENDLIKLFDFWGQAMNVSDQSVFIFKYSGIHDEEGKKTNLSELLTAAQRRSVHFCLS